MVLMPSLKHVFNKPLSSSSGPKTIEGLSLYTEILATGTLNLSSKNIVKFLIEIFSLTVFNMIEFRASSGSKVFKFFSLESMSSFL